MNGEEEEEKQVNEGHNKERELKADSNKEGEKEPWPDVIQIASVVEEAALATNLLYELMDADREQAKAEDDLGQMIANLPKPSRKIKKVWELHDMYKRACKGCIHGHNVTVDGFHMLKGKELLDNFVTYLFPLKFCLKFRTISF